MKLNILSVSVALGSLVGILLCGCHSTQEFVFNVNENMEIHIYSKHKPIQNEEKPDPIQELLTVKAEDLIRVKLDCIPECTIEIITDHSGIHMARQLLNPSHKAGWIYFRLVDLACPYRSKIQGNGFRTNRIYLRVRLSSGEYQNIGFLLNKPILVCI